MPGSDPSAPVPPDLLRLVERLIELRDALEAIAMALSDFQLDLDSPERRAAEFEAQQAIERARAQ